MRTAMLFYAGLPVFDPNIPEQQRIQPESNCSNSTRGTQKL
jgi:hypothetical protein